MVDKANINKLIGVIVQARPELCMMSSYSHSVGCGTAHCIGGWTNVIMKEEGLDGVRPHKRAQWLDIDIEQLEDMEFMHSAPFADLSEFDRLPSDTRKLYMVKYLTHLRDNGSVEWRDIIKDGQIQ